MIPKGYSFEHMPLAYNDTIEAVAVKCSPTTAPAMAPVIDFGVGWAKAAAKHTKGSIEVKQVDASWNTSFWCCHSREYYFISIESWRAWQKCSVSLMSGDLMLIPSLMAKLNLIWHLPAFKPQIWVTCAPRRETSNMTYDLVCWFAELLWIEQHCMAEWVKY